MQLAPVADQAVYSAEMARAREELEDNDEVLGLVATAAPAGRVARAVVAEVAREAAAIRFEREKAMQRGRDAAALCSRRVDALGRLAQLVVATRGLEPDADPRGPELQRVATLWRATVAHAARASLPEATAERFVGRLEELLAGWEDQVLPEEEPRH